MDAADIPPNFSVFVASEAEHSTGASELHRLYVGHGLAVRSRAYRRILEALVQHLDAFTRAFVDDRAIVQACSLVRDDEIHLVPERWRRTLAKEEGRWAAEDFRLVDRPTVELDLSTGEVVVPTADGWYGGGVPGPSAIGCGRPAARPGRYRLGSWWSERLRNGAGPAARVADAAHTVVNLGELDPAVVLPRLAARLHGLPGGRARLPERRQIADLRTPEHRRPRTGDVGGVT